MTMDIQELAPEITIMVAALHIPFKEVSLGSNLPKLTLIDLFGVVVVGIDRKDYSQVLNKVAASYPHYRCVFLTTTDNLLEKKDELLWDLMRSGYMRYIRYKFPHQFKNLISNTSMGRKIINERLKIWGDKAKFKFLVEENKNALLQSETYLTTIDPSFFDYMPEIIDTVTEV
jgi:hypothetical protein